MGKIRIIYFLITRFFWFISLVLKEWGLFVGLVEQIIKLLAGLVNLTPTRRDNDLVQSIEELFDVWQGKIYYYAEKIYFWYTYILKGDENENFK